MQKLSTPQNLTTLACESIKKSILEGNLSHDVRLTEESLSRQLGISKSPIREALNGLQNEGLIRIEPRRGAYLRRFTIKEAEDLYDLREALEVYAVSAVKITPQLIEELKSSVERTKKHLKARDKTLHIEEDSWFHGVIAKATGNCELCRVLENIQNQIWLLRCQTYDLSSSSAPSYGPFARGKMIFKRRNPIVPLAPECALLFVAISVFGWALQAKLSVYHTNPGDPASTSYMAKLSTEKSSARTVASGDDQDRRRPTWESQHFTSLVFSLLGRDVAPANLNHPEPGPVTLVATTCTAPISRVALLQFSPN